MGKRRPGGISRWSCTMYRLRKRNRLIDCFHRSMREVYRILNPRC
ncbi:MULTISPECIES: hypothetical protein [Clostridia]|nr:MULTISPECIES: hypothetical protein [Clostridia]